jgi:hypothetical protein
MRALVQKCAFFCADRLTLQERWLVLAFLGLMVLGSLVKYARARPESHPSSSQSPMPSLTPSTDDQR